MKIAHFADIHYRSKGFNEIHKCFKYAVDTAVSHSCDVGVIAGDIWDGSTLLDDDIVMAAVSNIKALADNMPVLMIYGTRSHDYPKSLDIFSTIQADYPIHVSSRIEQIFLSNNNTFEPNSSNGKILFSCLPSVSKANLLSRKNLDIAESHIAVKDLLFDVFREFGIINQQTNITTVLVAHGTVTGAKTSTGQIMIGKDIEFSLSDIQQAMADLVLLGHIHKFQAYNNVFYAGSTARLYYGEEEAKGFLIHNTETWKHSFIETPSRKKITIEIDPLCPKLPDDIKDSDVKVRYRISEEDSHKVNENEIKKLLDTTNTVDFEKTIIPKQRVRAEGISRIKTLSEKAKIWGETVGVEISEGILKKIEMVEIMNAEEIIDGYEHFKINQSN